MTEDPIFHEECVLANSEQEQQITAKLVAAGWKLILRVGEPGKLDYVRLVFKKDPWNSKATKAGNSRLKFSNKKAMRR